MPLVHISQPGQPSAPQSNVTTSEKQSEEVSTQALLLGKEYADHLPLAASFGRKFQGGGKLADYEKTKILGEGKFGRVYKALCKTSHVEVALKEHFPQNEAKGPPSGWIASQVIREVVILKSLWHPNVARLLDVFTEPVTDTKTQITSPRVFMAFPLALFDLEHALKHGQIHWTIGNVKFFMIQLLRGLSYMHKCHIIHRDLKPANLLVERDGTLKISDLGLARSTANDRSSGVSDMNTLAYTDQAVSLWYRAPEILMGSRAYGSSVDIWSVGCILGELRKKAPILEGQHEIDQLSKIWGLCGTPTSENMPYFGQCSPPSHNWGLPRDGQPRVNRIGAEFFNQGKSFCTFLSKMLVLDSTRRITAEDAFGDIFLWEDPQEEAPSM